MVKGKQDTRTIGATSSTTGLPRDEEVAKLFQALLRMASLELEGINGFNRRLKFLKMFISLSPPEYAGNLDNSLEALEWLRRVKQCFDVLDVPGDLRVGFAVYTLTGAASYWWDFVKRTSDVESMNWDDFEQIFLNRYFPETTREAKEEEFLNLTQGEMTVSQYDSKFIELSWHAPNLLTSDKDRAGKFLRGLRPSIRMSLRSFLYNTYHEAVAAALKIEQIENIKYQCVQESFEGASGRGGKGKGSSILATTVVSLVIFGLIAHIIRHLPHCNIEAKHTPSFFESFTCQNLIMMMKRKNQ